MLTDDLSVQGWDDDFIGLGLGRHLWDIESLNVMLMLRVWVCRRVLVVVWKEWSLMFHPLAGRCERATMQFLSCEHSETKCALAFWTALSSRSCVQLLDNLHSSIFHPSYFSSSPLTTTNHQFSTITCLAATIFIIAQPPV